MSDTPTPKKKVFLALPTYSNQMRRDFVLSLLDMLAFNPIPGVEWIVGSIAGDGVARSRNNLVHSFLTSTDAEYIVFVDVDIVFSRDHMERLIGHLSPSRPIVGGLYAAKQLSHRWIMTTLPNEVADENGLQRVKECGTGFKGYHRSYFDRVIAAFPEIAFRCDGVQTDKPIKWDFFSMGVVNGRYLSEDYYADYRAERIGMSVYVDTKLQLKHEGTFQYPLMSDMKITEKIPMTTIFKIAECMGATGHNVPSDEEVRISARLLKADIETEASAAA